MMMCTLNVCVSGCMMGGALHCIFFVIVMWTLFNDYQSSYQNMIFGKTLHSFLPFDSIQQHEPILFVLIFVFQICFLIPLRRIGDDEHMIDQWARLLVIQICPSLFEPPPPPLPGQIRLKWYWVMNNWHYWDCGATRLISRTSVEAVNRFEMINLDRETCVMNDLSYFF